MAFSIKTVLVLALLSPTAAFATTSFYRAAAQYSTLPTLPIDQVNADAFVNIGRPGSRRQGNSAEAGCPDGIPLTAIAYSSPSTATAEAVGALTTSASPTLWFYLPVPLSEASTQFTVTNNQGPTLYQGRLTGNANSNGIIGIPLSADLPPGVQYQWTLSLSCDDGAGTTVNDWIERRNPGPDLTRTFSQANARNRVALYTNYGFFQDRLSELAGLRRLNPDDDEINAAWRQTLADLNLSSLSNAPVLDCCQVSNAPIEESPEAELPEEIPDEPSENMQNDAPLNNSSPTEAQEQSEPVTSDSRSILQRARDRGN